MVTGVNAIPPFTRIQQTTVLLLDRSDPQVRFVTAADDETPRSFPIASPKPHRWLWCVRHHLRRRRRRRGQTRGKGFGGSIDRPAAKQQDSRLMELQQRSTGVLILARSMIYQDNWSLKQAGQILLIWAGVDQPRGSGRFGQSDPPFATLDLRNSSGPRSWAPLSVLCKPPVVSPRPWEKRVRENKKENSSG